MPPFTAMGLEEFADFERMDMDGITYQDVYFIKHRHTRNEPLHFHELVHVLQWRALGPERFTLAYALGHVLYGYANNPLENMAYTLQARFESSDPPFNVANNGAGVGLFGIMGTGATRMKNDGVFFSATEEDEGLSPRAQRAEAGSKPGGAAAVQKPW